MHPENEFCEVCRAAIVHDRETVTRAISHAAARVVIMPEANECYSISISGTGAQQGLRRLCKRNPVDLDRARRYASTLVVCVAGEYLEPETCRLDNRKFRRALSLSGTNIERLMQLLVEETGSHPAPV